MSLISIFYTCFIIDWFYRTMKLNWILKIQILRNYRLVLSKIIGSMNLTSLYTSNITNLQSIKSLKNAKILINEMSIYLCKIKHFFYIIHRTHVINLVVECIIYMTIYEDNFTPNANFKNAVLFTKCVEIRFLFFSFKK